MRITGPEGEIMKALLAAFMLTFVLALPAFAESVEMKISEMVITSKIVKGKPIDSIKRLSSSTDKNLYCYTRVTAPAGSDSYIRHLWYKGDEKVGEQRLPVRGGQWRTYSSKNIKKGLAGDWRVEAVDDSGTVLRIVKFRMN